MNEREIKEDRSTFCLTRFGAKSSNKKYLINCFVGGQFWSSACLCVSLKVGENKISLSPLFFFSFFLESDLDEESVFFVRWFWTPFFEQVVFALGVLFVPSASDVLPVVKRHFRLFD